MTNKLFMRRPRGYGKGGRECRVTGTHRAIIRKYGLMLSRKTFRERAELLGWTKVTFFDSSSNYLVPLIRKQGSVILVRVPFLTITNSWRK
jgi:ribosomal protein S14